MLFRRHQHDHLPPFHTRHLLYGGDFRQILFHPLQHLAAQLWMGDLAPTETQGYLGAVTIVEKLGQVAQLDVVIALLGSRSELDLFELNLLLLSLRGLFLFLLVKMILSDIGVKLNNSYWIT